MPASSQRAARFYSPSFALAGLTAWIAGRGAVTLSAHHQLPTALGGAWRELAGPAVIVVVLVAFACERLWPTERRRSLARGHVQDACWLILFAAIVVPLVTLLAVGSASLLDRYAGWLDTSWTASWPRWLVVGVTLIAMDGANWLTHLADHRLAPLWRVHAVHHSQEEMSVLTTFRVHPLVHTVSFFAATVPVVALTGARPLAPALITVYLCLGAVPHTNVPWSYGPLGKVVVSPAYHRIHHAAAGPSDVNLGIVLPWWDMLAGRAVFPQRGATPVRTGLAGRPLEVEQIGPRPRPVRVLAGQLSEPFRTPVIRAEGSAGAAVAHGEPGHAL